MCTYLGAIMHMHVGTSVCIWVCIYIGVVYKQVYACGCEHISKYPVGST